MAVHQGELVVQRTPKSRFPAYLMGLSILLTVAIVVGLQTQISSARRARASLEQEMAKLRGKLASTRSELTAKEQALTQITDKVESEKNRLANFQSQFSLLVEYAGARGVSVEDIQGFAATAQKAMSNVKETDSQDALLENYRRVLARAPARAPELLQSVFGSSSTSQLMTAEWLLESARNAKDSTESIQFLDQAVGLLDNTLVNPRLAKKEIVHARRLRGQALYQLGRRDRRPASIDALTRAFDDLDFVIQSNSDSFDVYNDAVQTAGLLYLSGASKKFPDYRSTTEYACQYRRDNVHRGNVCALRKWTLATHHLTGEEARQQACESAQLTNPAAYPEADSRHEELVAAKAAREAFCARRPK